MIDLGHFCLISAWLLTLYGFLFGIYGAAKRKRAWTSSAGNAVCAAALMSICALVSLAGAFIKHDYRYLYVWQTSNNDMPWYYLISAVWGGMDGSMLLWATLMAFFSAIVVWQLRSAPRDLARWVIPVLSGATNFFLLVVVFLTNPFRFVPPGAVQPDGNGLNPLLQNPSMLIHPPMLYCGFTGFVVPFAFCFAALLSGELGEGWIRLTRRWTLVAWSFLSCGIILGGNWAYIELGWGGFWAWDPVENASFLPWLTGTAFLHSVMVQERKGMLKVWNSSLSILTYLLSVFGTFLTRSGIVQSVHAFAATDVGWVFLAYIGAILLTAVCLIGYRWRELKPERHLESYLSREAAFLFNNLALLGICFATLWGVMFPVFSEWATGEKSVVGPPFFNKVNVPLFLILIFLMGVGPLIAWRKTSLRIVLKMFGQAFAVGSVVALFFFWLEPVRYLAAICFGLCVFVLMSIEGEFRRAVKARRELKEGSVPRTALDLVRKRPRRYGGFLVHIGVCVIAVAITASMAYKIEKDLSLKIGERAVVGKYTLELASLEEKNFSNYTALISQIKVYSASDSRYLSTLRPERRFYPRGEETTTEVDIRVTPRDDLYLALAGSDTQGLKQGDSFDPTTRPILLKVFINPLQVWLWLGAMIMLAGSLTVMLAGLRAPAKEYATQALGSQVLS